MEKIKQYLNNVKIEGISLSEFTYPGNPDPEDNLSNLMYERIMDIINEETKGIEKGVSGVERAADSLMKQSEQTTQRYIRAEKFIIELLNLSPFKLLISGKRRIRKYIKETLEQFNF